MTRPGVLAAIERSKAHRRRQRADHIAAIWNAPTRVRRTLPPRPRDREAIAELALEAEGRCMICEKPFESAHLVYLDHCHDTHVNRGLLCPGCNTGLGRFGDNVEGLQRAIRYLERLDS